ncbi:MAG TPA: hypothetical protein VGL05_21285 [Kribbella sp.]
MNAPIGAGPLSAVPQNAVPISGAALRALLERLGLLGASRHR